MNSLELTTPIKDKNSQYLIKVRHHHFEIRENLEMKQTVMCSFYTNAGTTDEPEFGEALLDVLKNQFDNEELTESQYMRDRERYKDFTFSSDTQDVMVDPETGVQVDPETEGAISELEFWQNALGDIATGVYGALTQSMDKMRLRNRL
jgi:hypothetical protein